MVEREDVFDVTTCHFSRDRTAFRELVDYETPDPDWQRIGKENRGSLSTNARPLQLIASTPHRFGNDPIRDIPEPALGYSRKS